jgi:putative acetyltransferase
MAMAEETGLEIRPAELSDAQEIKDLHARSVRALCRDHYTSDQIEAWLRNSTLEKYHRRLKLHRAFVGEINGEVVGYVRWNPASNELCSIFIDPGQVGQGYGRKLMKVAYEDAALLGVAELWLDASLNAVPFYQAEGWQVVKKRMHGPLQCIWMTKKL